MEAFFGIVGILIGSAISWFQNHQTNKQANDAKARYLAIRVVCVLDTYIESCFSAAKDDGLYYGQRTKDGYLEPQVASPGAPVFPDDVDWKSIDYDLMYRLLSLTSDVEAADRTISSVWDYVASPPDYEEGFEERALHYSKFGLRAFELASELRQKYAIPAKDYTEWNPVTDLTQELQKIEERRKKQAGNLIEIDDTSKAV